MRDIGAAMQRQSWRWLWIWVGVLAAGCSQIWPSGGTLSPTRTPSLWGYTLLPPTRTPLAWPPHTATPLTTADVTGGSASPLALYLHISGAACYETQIGSLACMGQVENGWDRAVEHVTVVVQLLARDGTPLASREALVSRWVLPAGAVGPYRVLFDALPEGFAEARSFVKSGQVTSQDAPHYAALTLQPASGAFVLGQYQVTLSVVNMTDQPVERITVTMTLLDDRGRVTGFRRVLLDDARRLRPGEALALTLKVLPQGPNTVAFRAFAEGYYARN